MRDRAEQTERRFQPTSRRMDAELGPCRPPASVAACWRSLRLKAVVPEARPVMPLESRVAPESACPEAAWDLAQARLVRKDVGRRNTSNSLKKMDRTWMFDGESIAPGRVKRLEALLVLSSEELW